MNRENHMEKDLKGNYLWVNREGTQGEGYEEMIFHEEKIQGLIPYYEIENMGESYLVYSLEYRKNYLQKLDGGRIRCLQLESLVRSLVRLMLVVDDYLLDPSNLVLEMDYVFEDDEGWCFVYVPGYQQDFWKQMEKLSEEWLNYVDYADERAVLWAYTFYDKVHGHGCSIKDFDEILNLEKAPYVLRENAMVQETTDQATEIHFQKEKKSLWQRLKRKNNKQLDKRGKKKKGKEEKVPDFFGKENSLEDTCPSLEITEEFGEVAGKTLTLIPMGDTPATVQRIEKIPSLIGRALDEVDVWIEDARVSRIHARMDYRDGQIVVVDMNSINGTYRNGERLKAGEPYNLHAGDIIKLADLEFICQWCA